MCTCVEVLFSFIIYLLILSVPHSFWDLSFLGPGKPPMNTALEAQSLTTGTAREVQVVILYKQIG